MRRSGPRPLQRSGSQPHGEHHCQRGGQGQRPAAAAAPSAAAPLRGIVGDRQRVADVCVEAVQVPGDLPQPGGPLSKRRVLGQPAFGAGSPLRTILAQDVVGEPRLMKTTLALLLSCGLLLGAAVPVLAEAGQMTARPNIVALAASDPQLSTLVRLVKSAGLVKALSGRSKLTVFAPTNAAFAKVPKATLTKLAHDRKLLVAVLEYHVVKGAFTAARIEKRTSLTTLEGARVKVAVRHGSVFIDQARVTKANLMASNGVVHVINGVLTPAGG